MDFMATIAEIDEEMKRMAEVRKALLKIQNNGKRPYHHKTKAKRKLSAAAKRHLSQMMKARWKERRVKQKKTKRKLSPAQLQAMRDNAAKARAARAKAA